MLKLLERVIDVIYFLCEIEKVDILQATTNEDENEKKKVKDAVARAASSITLDNTVYKCITCILLVMASSSPYPWGQL